MAYLKGDETLPPELLREIQKYIQGSLVYIPRDSKQRLGWGEKNGTREMLDQRDDEIRQGRAMGKSMAELAEEHCLSTDAIRKIVYRSERAS